MSLIKLHNVHFNALKLAESMCCCFFFKYFVHKENRNKITVKIRNRSLVFGGFLHVKSLLLDVVSVAKMHFALIMKSTSPATTECFLKMRPCISKKQEHACTESGMLFRVKSCNIEIDNVREALHPHLQSFREISVTKSAKFLSAPAKSPHTGQVPKRNVFALQHWFGMQNKTSWKNFYLRMLDCFVSSR